MSTPRKSRDAWAAPRSSPSVPSKIMESSIHSALSKGFFKQVRYLVDFGAAVNERDSERRTPLITCALVEDENWGVGLARTLIENGAMVGYRDSRGLNAFHYAVIYDRLLLVKIYLGSVDFDLNQADKLGNTALHYAAKGGNVELSRILLECFHKYHRDIDKANKQGVTPLIQAYKSGNLEVANALLQAGADSQAKDSVEHKTAHEWAHEAMLKKEEQSQTPATPCRERTIRYNTRRVRAMSAPANRVASAGTKRISVDESINSDLLVSKSSLSHRLYRSASSSNMRNQPEFILQSRGVDMFADTSHFRPVPAAPEHIGSAPAMTLDDTSGADWRGEIKKLICHFDFQFTQSYRRSVKPKVQPCINTEVPSRTGSPEPSESPSDTISDLASITSRRSVISRRGSIMKGEKNKKLSKSKRSGSIQQMASIPDM